MSDFAGVRTRSRNNEFSMGKNDFAGLRIRSANPTNTQIGDDWLPFLAKKGTSVISELPDIPANLANLGESGARWAAGKLASNNNPYRDGETTKALQHFSEQPNYFREENVDRPSRWIKEGLANYDIDITPQPRDGLQRIVGHGIEWAAPGGLLGKFSKAGKRVAVAGALGTTSGVAQEAGVDPLMADISMIGLQGGASKARNLLDRFSKSGKLRAREKQGNKAKRAEKTRKRRQVGGLARHLVFCRPKLANRTLATEQ